MIKLKMVVLIGVLLLVSAIARSNNTMYGVWSGTIGKAKINVCFQEYGHGSYYYLKYREPIRLQAADSLNLWFEPDSCTWTIDKVVDGSATGIWSQPAKKVAQPIKLTLLRGWEESDGEVPCGCNSYNDPIEKIPPIKIDTVQERGGRCYRTLNVEEGDNGMGWFELCGNSDAVVKLNEELRKNFPIGTDAAKIFYECRRGTLSSFGSTEYEFGRSVAPYLWFGNYLEVVEHAGGYCGGAHPSSGCTYRIFDLTTGEDAFLTDWIDENDDLHQLIIGGYARENEGNDDENGCVDLVKNNTSYLLRLDSTGVVFYTQFGHCCVACDQEFTVSFKDLEPFLTEEGRKKIKLLTK